MESFNRALCIVNEKTEETPQEETPVLIEHYVL